MHLAAGDHRNPLAAKLEQQQHLHQRQPGGVLAAAPGLQGEETGHVTRRRTGSVVKRPRHLDSPEPERVPLPPASGAAGGAANGVMATQTMAAETSSVSTPTPLGRARRVSFSTAKAPVVLSPFDSTTALDPSANPTLPPSPPAFPASASSPALDASLDSPAANAPSPLDPTGNSASPPLTPGSAAAAAAAAGLLKGRMPTFPLSDAYKPEPVDSRRHPRDLVPLDIGFPTPEMADKIRKEDQEDRLLMATCAVLHSHENRALCPKEIAEVMFQRDWLHNVGTTPFAHISTCIRSHLRRATTSNPPYAPILTSFELVGALTVAEVAAVGLVASDRPAVKRGALWYLDERVLGKGVGADDPFVRCRREAGLEPSELNGIYVRGMPPPVLLPHGFGEEDGDDEGGMGRGKRKRRASSAAIAALSTEVAIGSPASASTTPAVASPLAIPQPTRPPAPPAALGSRRSQTLAAPPPSAPAKSGVPRLRLRLAALEEVDSGLDDSDGFTSDAARRRSKNKKKVRRATSEGTSRAGSAEVDAMSEDEDEREVAHPGPGAFSSASSSALLAQSLLAASTSAPFTPSPLESTQEAVSPDSLNIGTSTTGGLFARPSTRQHNLSMSAPNIFSAFPSARSPEVMEVDTNSSSFYSNGDILPKSDPSEEDDFHEAMLRGEDFDFEWGSESYTTAGEDEAALSLPPFAKSKPKSREMSIGLPEAFDIKDDADALSTPATTPRSPQEEMEPPSGAVKMGMEATLCGAFAGHVDHPDEVIIKEEEDEDEGRVLDRATSTDSLTSIVDEDSSSPVNSPPATITRAPVDASTLSVPLPSPLALDLPPMLALSHPFAADYDFVGHEDDDRSAYRATQYERDMAESADDEDEEDDDIVTVKIEEEGSVGPEGSTAPSSRASSVYPAIESFSRRLMVTEMSCSSSSSGSSDSDAFDPLMIVSHSLLASGLPVPQPAPSPPDTTDWSMHLDLDEFDGDLNSSGDLLGPEMVGLEELDLAWADDETEEEWQTRSANARGLQGTSVSTFLTGSPVDCWTPVASRTASSDALRARVAVSPIASASKASPLASTMSRSPSAQSASAKAAAVAHPTTPLSIPITATIVERGVAVYATNIVDHDTATSFSLLRRIDVDYVNGTTLLRPTFTSPSERTSTLRDITDTFNVISGGDSIEGTWIPLSSARDLATRFAPSLGHLAPFLEDGLGQSFPSPIPELKLTLHSLFSSASSSASDGVQNWGHPLFAGTVDAEKALAPKSVDGGAKAAATAAAAVGKGARAGRGGRRSSLDDGGEESVVSRSGGRRRG